MRVLVTGGAGFIGSHVSDALMRASHEVLVVDDLSSGKRANVPAGARFEQLDIRSEALELLVRVYRPQAIFHFAAQIDVRKSMENPVLDAEINILGTTRIARAAQVASVERVVFASTGGAIYGEQDVFPADETHACRPVSQYGTSKLCAEEVLRFFERQGGPKAIALRYSNVYGPRQDPHGEAGVVAIFSRRMLSGKPVTIYGDGKQTRDYVFVGDVARANLLALELPRGGVFNIGTGIETDVNDLFGRLREWIPTEHRPVYAPARPGEQRRSVIDPGLAGRAFGFRPEVDLREGLRQTAQFFRDTPE